MPIQENIQIGNRYELQPKTFHRPITGKVTEIREGVLLVAVEHCDLCDREKLPEDRVIKAEAHDFKRALETNYFFS